MKKGKYSGQVNNGCRIVEIACCADCCSCTEVAELNGEYYCQKLLESIPKMFVSCDFLDDCPLPNAQQYIKEAQGTSTNSAMDEIATNLRGINLDLLNAYDLKGAVQRIQNCLQLLHQ